MTDWDWEVAEEVQGELQAELLRGLLEAQGIPTKLNQEGAGRAYGFSIGPLGTVQILVPEDYLDRAQLVLADYYSGAFEAPNDEPDEGEPP